MSQPTPPVDFPHLPGPTCRTNLTALRSLAVALVALAPFGASALGEEPDVASSYMLRYRFEPGETLRWKVLHLGTTETTVRGVTQTSRCRTLSLKVWEVTDVTEDADATFTHSVAWVDASNKVSDRAEVRYDSRKDAIPPEEFASVSPSIGRVLSKVTVTPRGQIRDKDSETKSFDLGLGEIVIPFPEEAIAVGSSWHVPDEVRVSLPDSTVERIKTRKTFTLRSVDKGIAELGIKTDILTPITNPRIKVQLLQKIPKGTVRFDLERGQIISRQMDWTESVVGFDGQDGAIQYLARFTEELVPDDSGSLEDSTPVAQKPNSDTPKTTEPTATTAFGPARPTARTATLDGLNAPKTTTDR